MVLATRYGINPKTVAKWRKRRHVTDARMGPKEVRSTVLSVEEEAAVVAFRRHTLLPLDERPSRTHEPDNQGSYRQALPLQFT
jgi:hypothetical protein